MGKPVIKKISEAVKFVYNLIYVKLLKEIADLYRSNRYGISQLSQYKRIMLFICFIQAIMRSLMMLFKKSPAVTFILADFTELSPFIYKISIIQNTIFLTTVLADYTLLTKVNHNFLYLVIIFLFTDHSNILTYLKLNVTIILQKDFLTFQKRYKGVEK